MASHTEGGRAATLDIWSTILTEKGGEREKGCGKSSLIARVINPDRVEKDDTKEATGLEYTFMRGRTGQSLEDTVVHLWELGGGKKMEALVDVVLTPNTIANALVLVMLDLSKPSTVFDDLLYWLKRIKKRTEECFRELRVGRLTKRVPDETKEKTRARFKDHPDASAISMPGIPVVFVGSKYDTFQSADMEVQKIMAKCLRFLAHSHGCSLVYYTVKDSSTVKRLRALANSYIFKTSLGSPNLDHIRPLFIPAGADAMNKIGFPSVPGGIGNFHGDPQDLWRQVFKNTFASYSGNQSDEEIDDIDIAEFAESAIDSMAKQKLDEIARYRLEVERREKEEEELRKRIEKGGLSSLTSATENGDDSNKTQKKSRPRPTKRTTTRGKSKKKSSEEV